MDDVRLRARSEEIADLIGAIDKLGKTKEWSSLKTKVFDGEIERLERLLMTEAKKSPIDERMLYTLQGQIVSAKRYDLSHLTELFRLELGNIKKQLNPPTAGV